MINEAIIWIFHILQRRYLFSLFITFTPLHFPLSFGKCFKRILLTQLLWTPLFELLICRYRRFTLGGQINFAGTSITR